MPHSGDNLEARVTALEHKVDAIRQDAAAARVLAGAADRDVSELRSELRGHTKVLNALRETQLEQGEQLAAQGAQLAAHGAQIAGLDAKVGSLDAKVNEGFTKMSIGMAQITALLTNAEGPERP